MTILNRYTLGIFGRLFLLSLAAFVGIFLLIDFMEKVDDFLEHGARLSLYFLYLANSVPIAAVQVIPMAILLATFGTIGNLSRSNELTAMRSGGVSIWRIVLPLLGASLLLTLFVLAATEYLIPLNQKKINHIHRVELKGELEIFYKVDHIWFREGNTVFSIQHSRPEKKQLTGITIFEFNDKFQLVSRMDAPRATFSKETWYFQDLSIHEFDPSTGMVTRSQIFPEKALGLQKQPKDFIEPVHKTEQMGFFELRALIQRLQAEGYDARRYKVDMHSRLAHPFTCLVMAILGIPFALRKGRGASLALGITFTVAIGITFFIIQSMMMAVGYAGALPPIIAAWSTIVLFAMLALWLLLSARD